MHDDLPDYLDGFQSMQVRCMLMHAIACFYLRFSLSSEDRDRAIESSEKALSVKKGKMGDEAPAAASTSVQSTKSYSTDRQRRLQMNLATFRGSTPPTGNIDRLRS